MVKVVSLFLIGMLVLAMFGKLRLPKPKMPKMMTSKKCPACGRHKIGSGPCACGAEKK
jgi:hypothetical protein